MLPPPNPKPVDLDFIQPHINRIVDQLAALGKEGSEYYVEFSNDAMNWAVHFRDDLAHCCAYHMMREISEIQLGMFSTIQVCKDSGCDEHSTHKFINAMIEIIGNNMNECANKAGIQQMLETRMN